MLRLIMLVGVSLALAACSDSPFALQRPSGDKGAATAPDGTVRPQARPDGLAAAKPPANARTVEEFDTTTADERRKAAAAPQPTGEQALGDTIASLGDPAKPGFWLETPLVKTAQKGRVFNPATGKSANVDLIPIDGPATAGSRISLAAMRLVEAPLTDLPTLQVFAGG